MWIEQWLDLIGYKATFEKMCFKGLSKWRNRIHGANVKGETVPDYGASEGEGPFSEGLSVCSWHTKHEAVRRWAYCDGTERTCTNFAQQLQRYFWQGIKNVLKSDNENMEATNKSKSSFPATELHQHQMHLLWMLKQHQTWTNLKIFWTDTQICQKTSFDYEWFTGKIHSMYKKIKSELNNNIRPDTKMLQGLWNSLQLYLYIYVLWHSVKY